MKIVSKRIASFRIALILAGAAVAGMAAPVAAMAAPYTISDPSGGDCALIGTWSLSAHTCTLTTDIAKSSAENGIEIASDGITLDGNGHLLTGFNKNASGVRAFSRNGVTVKNLIVSQFSRGIDLWNSGNVTANNITGNTVYANTDGIALSASPNNTITGNLVYLNVANGLDIFGSSPANSIMANVVAFNQKGLYLSASDNCIVYGNSFLNNTSFGVDVFATNGSSVIANNFIGNASPAHDFASTGLTVASNHWDTFDTPAEGCIDTTPFDAVCDGPYTPPPPGGGVTDSSCFLLPGAWNRADFTWYDDIGGSNWVLMANPADSAIDAWIDLTIAGTVKYIPPLAGYSFGQLPPNRTFTPTYPGLMDGPVEVTSRLPYPTPIVSQRILWPAGGDSLEEVPGTNAYTLSNRFWWTWYDMLSPGYKDWVLISNPNAFDVSAEIKIANTSVWYGIVPSRGRVTPTFPGVMGGPVSVQAFVSGSTDPAMVMASQRVLMNGDNDFNELPGMPEPSGGLLAWDHVWTWYDMTGGASNWVLIANPTTSINPIYYEISLAGVNIANGGPIASGQSAIPTFPGSIGGPVEVKTYFDPTHIWPAPSIVSQRSLWGGSFEEVMGTERSSLAASYDWTWYDQLSTGSLNWVLMANPSATETITATVAFTDQASGALQTLSQNIAPGGHWTPNFPGKMGGPVKVSAVLQGTSNTRPVIASQRVLWNGHFNEVWGQ